MSPRKALPIAAAIAIGVAAQPALSQTLSVSWPTGSRTYKINVNAPGRGDSATQTAAQRWGTQGAKFAFVNGGIEYDRDPAGGTTTSTDAAKSTIEDGSPTIVNGVESIAYVKKQAYFNGQMYDGDMIVNRNLILADGFYFSTTGTPPTSQYGYYSVMLHELGHIVGFDDQYAAPGCVSYGYIDKGQIQRTFCSAEVTALRNKYGAK